MLCHLDYYNGIDAFDNTGNVNLISTAVDPSFAKFNCYKLYTHHFSTQIKKSDVVCTVCKELRKTYSSMSLDIQ